MSILMRILRYAAFIAAAAAPGVAFGQNAPLPSGSTAYSPGMFYDLLSWSAFINATRVTETGGPNFECWATDQDTYPAAPTSTPPSWPENCKGSGASGRFQLSRLAAAHLADPSAAVLPNGLCAAPQTPQSQNFPTGAPLDCVAEEVRRNRDSFDYIAKHGLYWKKGLAKAFSEAGNVEFPWSAVELKADWTPVPTLIQWLANNGVTITEAEVENEYFTTTADKGVKYALVGMHISTKQLPNWLWASFEHKRNPARCDTMGCYDQFGAVAGQQSVAPHAKANQGYGDCPKTPFLAEMFRHAKVSKVADNYCLKATQIVATNDKLSVLDGNSFIEGINAGLLMQGNSCLTCHAYAAVDATGGIWKGFKGNPGLQQPLGPIGNYPQPLPGGKSIDFVWGILNAN